MVCCLLDGIAWSKNEIRLLSINQWDISWIFDCRPIFNFNTGSNFQYRSTGYSRTVGESRIVNLGGGFGKKGFQFCFVILC